MPVELAITADRRWAPSLDELIGATAAAGFTALGIGGDRVDAATIAAYKSAGLRCHEVLALTLTKDHAATVAHAERLAEAAAAIGADWVLTIFRAALTSETERTIQRCAAVIAESGAAMAVEFSPLGPIASIGKGLEVVAAANAGGGRAALMIDSWHFSFGDSTWEDLAAVPLDAIAYLQFTDALAPESDDVMHETMNRRALPGEGVLELDRFASTLLDRGWSGLVSAEVLSAELLALDANDLVARLRASMARYWG